MKLRCGDRAGRRGARVMGFNRDTIETQPEAAGRLSDEVSANRALANPTAWRQHKHVNYRSNGDGGTMSQKLGGLKFGTLRKAMSF